jgi:hypothetical protein
MSPSSFLGKSHIAAIHCRNTTGRTAGNEENQGEICLYCLRWKRGILNSVSIIPYKNPYHQSDSLSQPIFLHTSRQQGVLNITSLQDAIPSSSLLWRLH